MEISLQCKQIVFLRSNKRLYQNFVAKLNNIVTFLLSTLKRSFLTFNSIQISIPRILVIAIYIYIIYSYSTLPYFASTRSVTHIIIIDRVGLIFCTLLSTPFELGIAYNV